MLVTLLQLLGAVRVLADRRVLREERLAVTVQPVDHLHQIETQIVSSALLTNNKHKQLAHLFHVLLEQTQPKSLVQLNFANVEEVCDATMQLKNLQMQSNGVNTCMYSTY